MINQLIINGVIFALPSLPTNGRVLLHLAGGVLLTTTTLRSDEHVATMAAFLEIAERSGFEIRAPRGE